MDDEIARTVDLGLETQRQRFDNIVAEAIKEWTTANVLRSRLFDYVSLKSARQLIQKCIFIRTAAVGSPEIPVEVIAARLQFVVQPVFL